MMLHRPTLSVEDEQAAVAVGVVVLLVWLEAAEEGAAVGFPQELPIVLEKKECLGGLWEKVVVGWLFGVGSESTACSKKKWHL